jgi:hypothetical protein
MVRRISGATSRVHMRHSAAPTRRSQARKVASACCACPMYVTPACRTCHAIRCPPSYLLYVECRMSHRDGAAMRHNNRRVLPPWERWSLRPR